MSVPAPTGAAAHLCAVVPEPAVVAQVQEVGIAELTAGYRAGTLSPVAVVAAALEAAQASQGTLNAFVTLCPETALAQAREAEQGYAAGRPMGPLAGVPVSIKDIIATAGVRTTFGSLPMAANVPQADAVSVRRLRAAGAILIGKTTTPEFACRQTTTSRLSGVTRNPWDLALTPGGSSGGSAASIAAGIGHVSLVTDGGGSSRLPAACTGIVGMKPTFGLIPYDTALDVFGGLAHLGLMGRCADDVAAALVVVAGPDDADPASLRAPDEAPVPAPAGEWPLAGLRVGWRERFAGEAIDPAMLEPCLRALSRMEDLGAVVEPVEGEIEPSLPIWRTLQHSIWAERFADRLAQTGAEIDPVIAAGIAEAEGYSARTLQAAIYGRGRLFRCVQGWLGRHDVIVTPTLSRPPLAAEHPGTGPIEVAGRPAGDIRAAWAPLLGLFTMTGHPALSLNCGWTPAGLPVGLQLVGRWHGDRHLLALARTLEGALPDARRCPPAHPAGAVAPRFQTDL